MEQAHAASRRDAHWDEVLRKQALARHLRVRLAAERAEEEDAHQAYLAAPSGYVLTRRVRISRNVGYNEEYPKEEIDKRTRQAALCSEYYAKMATADATASELKEAEKAPLGVVQPLPSGDADALGAWEGCPVAQNAI